ncbi:MAG: excinuclease ABC subunit UvrC [Spirochaetaceae bacterium]|nr:excinuclease ABC subunit UvrC [Spirochaetaceae bacterium]
MDFAALKKQASEAPLESGCYIMRDEKGKIIYVGKAKILRKRLQSYFSGAKDIKTATLMRTVRSIETIIVSNEYEALLLENTLIKQYTPKYNISLKDGKSYPVIRITAEDFPKIFKTRFIVEDGSRYFGPFPNVKALDNLLNTLLKIFPIRKCGILRKRKTPCVYFHIEQCQAPCCGKITAVKYARYVEHIAKLLEGDTTPITVELTQKMHKAARNLFFEKAARYRNTINAISELSSLNAVVDFDTESRDYIASASEGVLSSYTVFSMRGGKLSNRELYRTKSAAGNYDSLETFIMSYYSPDNPPPAKIYVEEHPIEVDERAPETDNSDYTEKDTNRDTTLLYNIKKYIHDQFNLMPEITIPNDKRHRAALAMAKQNALEDLRKQLKERGAGAALDELKSALHLQNRPERIEGFDIAQLDGKHPVASLISFYNGVPDKKNYRYFKLRSVIGIVDDFASMREAVRRRYSRLLAENKELPDMILIDGGIGQVNAAKGVLDELGVYCDIAGLAKRDEEIWLPSETIPAKPIKLPRDSEALKILQAVRDETHRFATGFNQRLRSKDLSFDSLESVEGIGPKRAALLIKEFQSIKNIAAAKPEEIHKRCFISLELAQTAIAASRLALENQAARKKALIGPRVEGIGISCP